MWNLLRDFELYCLKEEAKYVHCLAFPLGASPVLIAATTQSGTPNGDSERDALPRAV